MFIIFSFFLQGIEGMKGEDGPPGQSGPPVSTNNLLVSRISKVKGQHMDHIRSSKGQIN